jgi:hypothetical protein
VYKEAYVDCLTLLNDVLVIFGSDPQNPTFPDVEEVIEGLDRATKRLVVDGQDDSVRDEEVESQLKSVHKNAHANREVAYTLRKLSTHPDDEGLGYKIRGLVDNYLDDMLKQYSRIQFFSRTRIEMYC